MKEFLTFCIGFGLLSIAFFVAKNNKFFDEYNNKESKDVLHSVVVKYDDGYGYRIFNGDRLVIQQEFIPGVKGNLKFESGEMAKNVAEKVVHKLANGKNPIITIKELRVLGVVD